MRSILAGRSRVVFVDASVRANPPFEFSRIAPQRDQSFSTHAISPEAVLAAHRGIAGEPPESWVLGIRGEAFELGDPLSAPARAHLDAAIAFFVQEARRGAAAVAGRLIEIEGRCKESVSAPGFHRLATSLGLAGEVRNTPEGVSIEAFGSEAALDALVRAIATAPPAGARVRDVSACAIPPGPRTGSASSPAHRARRPSSRCRRISRPVPTACARSRIPATATTATPSPAASRAARASPSPPRSLTIARRRRWPCSRRAPPARASTAPPAIAAFTPRPWPAPPAAPGSGSPTRRDTSAHPPARSKTRWCCSARGGSLGFKGLGAFHLVCDATNPAAVAELRRRKRRDSQPFAVMVPSLAAAETVAALDEAARAALVSPARPIVLAPARPGALAPGVNGPSRRTGVLLPYTPLHLGLAAGVGRPLVVTSGNPSGGPAIIDHEEARARLGGIVDAFLLHDRPIARRVEDSVVAASAAGTRILRRSRGFAPVPLRLPRPAPEPVLAVGGHQKNSACFVVGDLAYLTPHLGDLGLAESEAAWRRDLEDFERLLGVTPRSSPTIFTRTMPPRGSHRRARPPVASACSTTSPTCSPRSPSTTSPSRFWASSSTARGRGPDGTSWGGNSWSSTARAGRGGRPAARSPCPAGSGRSGRSGGWRSPRSTPPSAPMRRAPSPGGSRSSPRFLTPRWRPWRA